MAGAVIRHFNSSRDVTGLKDFLDAKDCPRLDLCARAAADGDAMILVAELEGAAIGLTAAHTRFRDDMGWDAGDGTRAWLQAGDAYLEFMEVRKDLRNCGIGARLMQAMEEAVRARGIQKMWLHTGEANTGAQRFYTRHGWKHVATVQVPWQPEGKLSRIYCRELVPPLSRRSGH